MLSVNVRAGAGIVVLAVVNSAQVDEALFGPQGAISGDFFSFISFPWPSSGLNTLHVQRIHRHKYLCMWRKVN